MCPTLWQSAPLATLWDGSLPITATYSRKNSWYIFIRTIIATHVMLSYWWNDPHSVYVQGTVHFSVFHQTIGEVNQFTRQEAFYHYNRAKNRYNCVTCQYCHSSSASCETLTSNVIMHHQMITAEWSCSPLERMGQTTSMPVGWRFIIFFFFFFFFLISDMIQPHSYIHRVMGTV